MCCLPMVINADGIKLNGVAPSVWSLWYSFLAMIQLPRYSCAPRQLRHIQPRLCRTIWTNCSDRPCRNRQKYWTMASSDMPRSRRISWEIRGTHGADVVDTSSPIVSGPKDRSTLTAEPFRLPLVIACFPSEMAKRIRRTWVRSLGLQFRPDQETTRQ